MPETIVLIVDDLLFLPRLQNGLQQLGYQTIEATDESRLTQALFKLPVLVLVDLFSRSFDWAALLALVQRSKVGPVPVLGFGPHVDLVLREQALAAGCVAVVGRGAVVGPQLAQLVEKHRARSNQADCLPAPPELLRQGIDLFNAGEYFEAHEVIEAAWNAEPGPVRVMFQGVLQIGVACYHIQGRNWRGAMKVLERGEAKLRPFIPTCMGLDLARLLVDAHLLRGELLRLGPEWQGEFDAALFPTIRMKE
jgi:hypothetical protein